MQGIKLLTISFILQCLKSDGENKSTCEWVKVMKLFIISICVAAGSNAQSLHLSLTVENTWQQAKENEPIVLKLNELKELEKKLDFQVRSATVTTEGKALPYQLDDIDGDNRADELVFLADIKGKTTQTYNVTLSSADDTTHFTPRVYADMQLDDKRGKHPFITSIEAPGSSYIYSDLYHHGAAFESELTAYRIYFDHRQNIDIYGKQLRQLELADTHFYSTPQQMQQGYGNDVLWAGNSIGCGSFKGWDGTAPTNIEPVTTRGQKVIATGPLRTIVKVWDYGWNNKSSNGQNSGQGNEQNSGQGNEHNNGIGNGHNSGNGNVQSTLNMTQYYILYAGHRDCEVHVTFDRPLTGETFTTGVQKVGSQPQGFANGNGIAASWGSDYPEMGKKDQYPPEAVGMAVYVPTQFIQSAHESDLNYLFVLHAPKQTQLNYHVSFCADKEKEGYHSAAEWFDAVNQWKEQLEHPVKVKIKGLKKM